MSKKKDNYNDLVIGSSLINHFISSLPSLPKLIVTLLNNYIITQSYISRNSTYFLKLLLDCQLAKRDYL